MRNVGPTTRARSHRPTASITRTEQMTQFGLLSLSPRGSLSALPRIFNREERAPMGSHLHRCPSGRSCLGVISTSCHICIRAPGKPNDTLAGAPSAHHRPLWRPADCLPTLWQRPVCVVLIHEAVNAAQLCKDLTCL